MVRLLLPLIQYKCFPNYILSLRDFPFLQQTIYSQKGFILKIFHEGVCFTDAS